MNPFLTHIASQQLRDMRETANRARLIREASHRPPRMPSQETEMTKPPNGRWTRTRSAVRHWFACNQLGPIDNYVAR